MNLTPRSLSSARNSGDGYASSSHPRDMAPVLTSTSLPDAAISSAVRSTSSQYHAADALDCAFDRFAKEENYERIA